MQTHKEYTFWILPAEPLRSQLKSVISALAREFDAVDFDPHCTVFCSVSSDATAVALAEYIVKTFAPFTLKTERLMQSSSLTKTFYMQLEETATLHRLFKNMRDRTTAPVHYELNPHVSLLYQDINEAQRKQLCTRWIALPPGPWLFDTLRVVEMDVPVTDLQPLRTWRTVGEYKLRGN